MFVHLVGCATNAFMHVSMFVHLVGCAFGWLCNWLDVHLVGCAIGWMCIWLDVHLVCGDPYPSSL